MYVQYVQYVCMEWNEALGRSAQSHEREECESSYCFKYNDSILFPLSKLELCTVDLGFAQNKSSPATSKLLMFYFNSSMEENPDKTLQYVVTHIYDGLLQDHRNQWDKTGKFVLCCACAN